MKELFDDLSYKCSLEVTSAYSTSFSLAVKMLSPKIQKDIYAIYGFVRFADEIVDTFHDYEKKVLLDEFEADLFRAIDRVSKRLRRVWEVVSQLRPPTNRRTGMGAAERSAPSEEATAMFCMACSMLGRMWSIGTKLTWTWSKVF